MFRALSFLNLLFTFSSLIDPKIDKFISVTLNSRFWPIQMTDKMTWFQPTVTFDIILESKNFQIFRDSGHEWLLIKIIGNFLNPKSNIPMNKKNAAFLRFLEGHCIKFTWYKTTFSRLEINKKWKWFGKDDRLVDFSRIRKIWVKIWLLSVIYRIFRVNSKSWESTTDMDGVK